MPFSMPPVPMLPPANPSPGRHQADSCWTARVLLPGGGVKHSGGRGEGARLHGIDPMAAGGCGASRPSSSCAVAANSGGGQVGAAAHEAPGGTKKAVWPPGGQAPRQAAGCSGACALQSEQDERVRKPCQQLASAERKSFKP